MFRKTVKIITAVIAMAMVFVMGLGYPLQVSAESIPKYISEVKMATAPTKEEAVKVLEDAGYTVCDYNLRDGVSGNVCYMGYKTTTDSSKAVTDIRLMNDTGGVNEQSFRDLKKSWKSGLTTSTEYFKAACLDVKAKYEAGSPLAASAVEILNLFDYDGTKLSDYLFSSDRTDADYEDILLICADNVVSAVYNAIMLGTADYGSTNFAEKVGKVDASKYSYDVIENSSDVDEYAELWDKVDRIITNLQDYGATYDEAVLYFEENEEELKEMYSSYFATGNTDKAETTTKAETATKAETTTNKLGITKSSGITNGNGTAPTALDLDSIEIQTTAKAATTAATTTTAAATTTEADEDNSSDVSDVIDDEEETEYWKNFIDDYYKNSDDQEENELYTYAQALGTYEKLEAYASPDSKYDNLAEYIYACTTPTDSSTKEADLKKLVYSIYPFVSVLDDGQMFTLQYGGLSALVNQLDKNTKSKEKEIKALTEEVRSKVESNGVDSISIFYNVNRDIYDQTVAFTDEATREAASKSSYDKLTYVEEDDELTQNLTKTIFISAIIAGSILAATALIMSITAAVTGSTVMTLLSVGYAAILSFSIGTALGGMTLTVGAVVMGIIGTVTVVIALVLLAIILICFIIRIIKKIIEKETEEDYVAPSIPDIMYDVNEGNFTKYDAVTDVSGKAVNYTLKNSSDCWDVMYTSTNQEAGEPIQVNGENPFSYYTNVSSVPSDATPIRRFGSEDPANLNSYQSNPGHALYIAYTADGTAEYGDDSGTKYLYSMSLAVEDSAEAARLNLTQSGFTPIEQNLTPYSGKVSYIGYKTTTDESEAVTDIRIAYYYSADTFNFGTTANGAAAVYTKVGTLNTQATIYYTKQRSNGSPVLPDFKITDTLLGADSGYEGVNLFSGGEAFNLINGSDNYSGVRALESHWNNCLYLYFKPSETYGSDSPEYLSGFAFSNGVSNCIDSAQKCGFKVIPVLNGYNLTNGLTATPEYNGVPTYMLWSTTHNPYRAITEIRVHEGGSRATALYENMSAGTVGYAACETFACIQVESPYWGNLDITEYRLIRPSNAFITRLTYEGADNRADNVSSEYSAENNIGKYADIPTTGLYVAGPNAKKDPLTLDDIYFCRGRYDTDLTSFTNSKGETVKCRPVNDFTDCYSTTAKNLTFEWEVNTDSEGAYNSYYSKEIEFDNYLRIYYKGSVPTKGKYVKNIIAASVDSDGYSYDQAIAKLISNGEGEIKQVNLSRSRSSQPVTYENFEDDNGKTVRREVVHGYEGKSTYVMITYTDTLIGAMRNLVTDWDSADVTAKAKKIKNQGADYYLCGDPVYGQSGNYLLYSTSNGYCGSAITEVVVDEYYLSTGCVTASALDGVLRTCEDNTFKLRCINDRIKGYVKNVCITAKDSKWSALKDLYERGCTAAIIEDKNGGLGGDYVFIGYSTTSDRTDNEIVTGIKVDVQSGEVSKDWWIDGYTQAYYDRISNDMNDDVGGKYTYLYVSTSKRLDPITGLDSYHLKTETLEGYTDFVFDEWQTTANASEGTGKYYALVYTKMDYSDWTLSDDGTLTIDGYGNLPYFEENRSVTFPRSDWNNGNWKTVNEEAKITRIPEWYEYRNKIKKVVIGKNITRITRYTLMGLNDIESVAVYNPDCMLMEYCIPDSAVIYGYRGSWAEGYAANEVYDVAGFMYIESLSGTTMLGEGNIAVISGISLIMIALGAGFIIVRKKKEKTGTAAEGDDNTDMKEES